MTPHTQIDPGLVQETRLQIHDLMAELAELARSDIPRTDFYREVLSRLVAALAAVGGAIWTVDSAGNLALQYQINLPETGLPREGTDLQRHARLVSHALSAARGMSVPPHSQATDDDQAGNPTGCLLLLAPLLSEERHYGVVEIFQRAGGGAVTQRGYLRFLLEVCSLASDYLRRHELREYAGRQALWGQLQEFCRAAHAGLDPRQTSLVIANEGRRLVGCDRLSVAIVRGRRPRIAAISGQESIERRATSVRLLDRLVAAVVAGGEPVWYRGDTRDFAPQIEMAIERYVDGTEHSKVVGVLPLLRPTPEDAAEKPRRNKRPEVIGALVVEQFQNSQMPDDMLERLRVVSEHSELALANSLAHHELFLLPLWRAIGRSRAVIAVRNLPKTVAVVGGVVAVGAALALVPADFDIEARGTLQPSIRRDIFVRESGVVTSVSVDHAEQVKKGQTLAQIRSRDLEVSIADLVGRKAATEAQIASLRSSRAESRLGFEDQNRMAGQLQQLEKTLESLARQHDLLLKKQEQLTLHSPINGQVVTWDVKNLLDERPVEKGQILMSVADPAGDWQLELHLREDRAGYVVRTWNEVQAARKTAGDAKSDANLGVDYILATAPGHHLQGSVVQIDAAADVRGEEGNTVLVKVAVDRAAIDAAELRPGATASARIHCGRRSLGYVWFHELIAAIQSRVLFRL